MRSSAITTILVLCIALGLVTSACGAFGFWVYGYSQNAWERCDAKKSPEGAVEVLEAQLERTDFTYLPLGVECTWAMADGSSLSKQYPSVRLTIAVYGGLALWVGGIVALVVGSNRRDRGEPAKRVVPSVHG